jgi:hypothetical protein
VYGGIVSKVIMSIMNLYTQKIMLANLLKINLGRNNCY